MISIEGQSAGLQFYHGLVATSNSLALSQLWTVEIPQQSFLNIHTFLKENFENYEGWINKWDIFTAAKDTFQTRWFIGDTHYLLAKGVTFPGDSFGIDYAGSNQTGLLKAPVGTGRNNLPEVTITFLETNQSVADLFFRPWAILVSHWSLKEQALRIPITLTCFQKGGTNSPLVVRKRFILEQAAPISIDTEEYNYTADKVIDRQIKFVYTRYHVSTDKDYKHFTTDDAMEYQNLVNIHKSKGYENSYIDRKTADQKVVSQETLKQATIIPPGLEIEISQPAPDKKTLIQKLSQIKDLANRVFIEGKGMADDIHAGVAGSLRLFAPTFKEAGKLADKIDKQYQRTQDKIIKPMGEVVTTGNYWWQGIETAANAARRIADRIESWNPAGRAERRYNDDQKLRTDLVAAQEQDRVLGALINTLKTVEPKGAYSKFPDPGSSFVDIVQSKPLGTETGIYPVKIQEYKLLPLTPEGREAFITEASKQEVALAVDLETSAQTVAKIESEAGIRAQKPFEKKPNGGTGVLGPRAYRVFEVQKQEYQQYGKPIYASSVFGAPVPITRPAIKSTGTKGFKILGAAKVD